MWRSSIEAEGRSSLDQTRPPGTLLLWRRGCDHPLVAAHRSGSNVRRHWPEVEIQGRSDATSESDICKCAVCFQRPYYSGQLNEIAVSDRPTLEGLTQFPFASTGAWQQTLGTVGHVRSNVREGRFCATLFQTACNSLILKRRDGGVVDRARLESVCRGNSTVGSNPTLSANIFR